MHIFPALESVFLDIFLPALVACIVNLCLFYFIQLLTDPDFDELLPESCVGVKNDEEIVIQIEDEPEKRKIVNTKAKKTVSLPFQKSDLQKPTFTPYSSANNSKNTSDINLKNQQHITYQQKIAGHTINQTIPDTTNLITLQNIKNHPRRPALSSNNSRQTLLSTKIWNQLVSDFRKSMHQNSRRLWAKPVPYRFYDMVFTGKESFEWAEQYLCILRIQLGSRMGNAGINVHAGAIALNRKLLQCFVMTDVRSDRIFVNNSFHYYHLLPPKERMPLRVTRPMVPETPNSTFWENSKKSIFSLKRRNSLI